MSVGKVSIGKEFVIQVGYGGLGDHLFHSHLPRIAKATGAYSRVLVSRRSVCRNESYLQLVWEQNPYVDGFCDEEALIPEFEHVEPGMNLLDKIMLERGLDDGARFHEPEVYYKPKVIPELSGKRLYDPNYVSNAGYIPPREFQQFFRERGLPDLQLSPGAKSHPAPGECPEMKTKDLWEYCDFIASCEEFMCLTSGGATLAAALGKRATVLYGRGVLPRFHHSRLHTYVLLQLPLWRRSLGKIKRRLMAGDAAKG